MDLAVLSFGDLALDASAVDDTHALIPSPNLSLVGAWRMTRFGQVLRLPEAERFPPPSGVAPTGTRSPSSWQQAGTPSNGFFA